MVAQALVTGASGFIGRALTAHLQQQGYAVRLLQHRTAAAGTWRVEPHVEPGKKRGAESSAEPTMLPQNIVQGSLDDVALLQQACRGVDIVFHLAAYSHVNQHDPEAMRRINVEGTRNLLEAAVKAGVRRIVYFSSSLADDNGGAPATLYGQTKRDAEKCLLQACAEGAIEAVCLRPVNVYGPGMKGNLRTLIRLIRRGVFPPLPASPHRLSLVGVQDLCRAAQLAAEAPQANGQIYCVTDGVAYSMQDVERAIRSALGRPQPRWTAPGWLLYLAALTLELLGRLLRLENAPGLRSYRALATHNLSSSEKISHELGYNPAATFQSTLPQILQYADV